MTRLFVAAWPPGDVAEQLATLGPADQQGVRRLPVEQLHVTLRFLGDTDPDEALGRMAACNLPASTARVGPAVQRLGRGQLVVPVTGVDGLAAAVDEATVDLGAPRRHPFFGHVTLARTKRDAHSWIEHAEVTADFPVEDVRLVESRLDPAGSVYRMVAAIPVG